MEIKQIKEELRRIRYGQRSIDALLKVIEHKKRRLDVLEAHESSGAQSIDNLRKSIEKQEHRLDRAIEEQESLEARFDDAIASLEAMDQIIIREGYIGGASNAELGERLGYSVRGIENRLRCIFVRLSELL